MDKVSDVMNRVNHINKQQANLKVENSSNHEASQTTHAEVANKNECNKQKHQPVGKISFKPLLYQRQQCKQLKFFVNDITLNMKELDIHHRINYFFKHIAPQNKIEIFTNKITFDQFSNVKRAVFIITTDELINMERINNSLDRFFGDFE